MGAGVAVSASNFAWAQAQGQNLTIGVRAGPDSMDPHFTATGTHIPATPGPQDADAKPAGVTAHYVGSVSGSTMILEVQPAGASRMTSYTLTQGRRAKLMRCM